MQPASPTKDQASFISWIEGPSPLLSMSALMEFDFLEGW